MTTPRILPSSPTLFAYSAMASSSGASSSASTLPPNEPDAVNRHVAEVLAQADQDGFVEGATTLATDIPANREEFFKFRFAQERNRRAEQGIGETRGAYVAKRLQDEITRLKSAMQEAAFERRVQFPGDPADKERHVLLLAQTFFPWATLNPEHERVVQYVWLHLERACFSQEMEVLARKELETQWSNASLGHIPLIDVITPEMHAEWKGAVEDYARAQCRQPPSRSGEHVAKRLRKASPKPQSRRFPEAIWTAAEEEARQFAPGSLPDCVHVEREADTGRAVYVVEGDFMELRRVDAQAHTDSMPDMPALTLAIASHMAWQQEQSLESFGFPDDILKAAQSIAHQDSHCIEGLRQYTDGAYRARYKGQDLPRVAPHGALDDRKARTVAIARILSAVVADNTLKDNPHYLEYEETKNATALLPLILRKETSLREIIAPAFGDLSIPSLESSVRKAANWLHRLNLVWHLEEEPESGDKEVRHMALRIKANDIYFGSMSTRQFPRESGGEVQLRAATATILGEEYLQFVDSVVSQESENGGANEVTGIPSPFDNYINLRIEQEAAKHVGDKLEAREAHIERRIEQEVRELNRGRVPEHIERLVAELEEMPEVIEQIKREVERRWLAVSENSDAKTALAESFHNSRGFRVDDGSRFSKDYYAYRRLKVETRKGVRDTLYRQKLEEFARANLSAEWSSNALPNLHQTQMEWEFRLRNGDQSALAKRTFRAEWLNAAEDWARSGFVARYKRKLRLEDMPVEVIGKIFGDLPREDKLNFVRTSRTLWHKARAGGAPALKLFERTERIRKPHDAGRRFRKFKSVLEAAGKLSPKSRFAAYVALADAPQFLRREAAAGTVLLLESVKKKKLFDRSDYEYSSHPDRDVITPTPKEMDEAKHGILIGIASLMNIKSRRRVLVQMSLNNLEDPINQCIDPLFALLESIEDERLINKMDYMGGLAKWCKLLPDPERLAYLGKLVTFVEKRKDRLSDPAKAKAIKQLALRFDEMIRRQEQKPAMIGIMRQLVDVAETLKDENAMLNATRALISCLHILGEAAAPVRRGVAMIKRFADAVRSPEIGFSMHNLQQRSDYQAILALVDAA